MRNPIVTTKSSPTVGEPEETRRPDVEAGMTLSTIPSAEPRDCQGWASPYYDDGHHAWRRKVREVVEAEMIPFGAQWEEDGSFPALLLRKKLYAAGVFGAAWPVEWGGTPPEGSVDSAGQLCPFYSIITTDELTRCPAPGVLSSLLSLAIALPPVSAASSNLHPCAYMRPLSEAATVAAYPLCLS